MTRRNVVRCGHWQDAQRIGRLDFGARRCRVIEEEWALLGDDLVHAMPPQSVDRVAVLQEHVGLGIVSNFVQIIAQGVRGLGHAARKNHRVLLVGVETRPSRHRLIIDSRVGIGDRRDWVDSKRI